MLGGGYLYFSGQDNVVVKPLFLHVINHFTYEFWVKPGTTQSLPVESTTGISRSEELRFVIAPGFGETENQAGLGVSIGTNGISIHEHTDHYLPATLVFPAHIYDWTHVAIVYSNNTPYLYLNGVLRKVGLKSPKSMVYASGVFGSLKPYGSFIGSVDDIRIWSTVRTREQILSTMYVDLTGKESGLIGCWTFDEHTPSVALDRTDNQHHGQINGAELQFFFPAAGNTWTEKYPRFITDHLDYLQRYCTNDTNRHFMKKLITNTRNKGYIDDVLMLFNVYRKDYHLFFYPVAEELVRRGYSVTILIPQEGLLDEYEGSLPPQVKFVTLEEVVSNFPVFPVAQQYFEDHLKQALIQWFHDENMPAELQHSLLEYYLRYSNEKMMMLALLHLVKPKCVYGLHFISNPGCLDAIQVINEHNKVVKILMQHGFLFGDAVDVHDFKGADIVILWGEYHRTILDNKSDKKNTVVLGNPKLERVKEIASGQQHNSSTATQMNKILYISSDSPRLSTKSQENLELFIESTHILDGLDIVYKIHPVEAKEDYNEYFQNGSIAPHQLSDRNVYELIQGSDIIVGDNSTAVFEAATMGKPVIQIHLQHQDPAHILFTRAASIQELRNTIQRLQMDPSYVNQILFEQQQWSVQMFSQLDGTAQRVAEFIINTIK
ncbi:LamG-like jellyroll fold domain-containing protein [Paenibacillus rigui]|uniref:LamG-like jellyroll fold domain-containing protein n=1 Tax=Paenibacillus rigui TaxID=554312 RepID=A0A229UHZ5_9BACL|nr:LamG-like jellyroll fold domain-containing protein [Paenibacillus rigui]OXM83057.1 hypothetical protein CF651_27990 [Paenibacillus rigui]